MKLLEKVKGVVTKETAIKVVKAVAGAIFKQATPRRLLVLAIIAALGSLGYTVDEATVTTILTMLGM